jgi:digalactosyldiacylglycerol synthase
LFAADSLHTDALDADAAADADTTAPLSLAAPGRSFTIVTTAALPWLTGTAVNPALRAAYLARALPRSKVRLLLPWLALADQARVFAPTLRFASPAAQQEWVRAWLADRMGLQSAGGDGGGTSESASTLPAFDFVWYQGRYDPTLCSIFPYGNLIDLVPAPERDVAILEEPEHLTWYHHGPRWSDAFGVAIGVAHTNYVDYVRAAKGAAAARVLRAANAALVGAHCHRVVKLSGAVQRLPRQVTCFVHGVAPVFLQVGCAGEGGAGGEGAPGASPPPPAATRGCYFLGKALLAKGWVNLLDLLDPACPGLPPGASPPAVDGFGSGEDAAAIAQAAAASGAPLTMHPGIDHLSPTLRSYRVFLNPSTSDVVATTSAEALAMGRWLVVPLHPCNAFFAGFAGCLVYDSTAEFYAAMATALASPPPRLTPEEARALTWQAATERFLEVAAGPVDGGGGGGGGRGVRRSPSEDAGFCSDGGPGGGAPAHLADLPRGGSGAASAAALSALAPGDDKDDAVSSGGAAFGLPQQQTPLHPPTALGHSSRSLGSASAASGDGAALDGSAPPSATASGRGGIPRSSSTLAFFAPDPSPAKARPNPAARLAGRAGAALGAVAYRAFEAASGVEAVRRVMGAGAFTRDAPAAPPGAFDPADRAALAAAAAGREAAADAHARLGYPRPRYVG